MTAARPFTPATARETYAGKCVECGRTFTRRLTRGERWSCPHCGTWQAGPGATARRLAAERQRRDRERRRAR